MDELTTLSILLCSKRLNFAKGGRRLAAVRALCKMAIYHAPVRQGSSTEGRRADRKGICERGSEAEAEKADATDSLGGGGKDGGGLGLGGGVGKPNIELVSLTASV